MTIYGMYIQKSEDGKGIGGKEKEVEGRMKKMIYPDSDMIGNVDGGYINEEKRNYRIKRHKPMRILP